MNVFEGALVPQYVRGHPVGDVLGVVGHRSANSYVGISNAGIIIDAAESVVEIQCQTSFILQAIHDLECGRCIGSQVIGLCQSLGGFNDRDRIVPIVVPKLIRLSIAFVYRQPGSEPIHGTNGIPEERSTEEIRGALITARQTSFYRPFLRKLRGDAGAERSAVIIYAFGRCFGGIIAARHVVRGLITTSTDVQIVLGIFTLTKHLFEPIGIDGGIDAIRSQQRVVG